MIPPISSAPIFLLLSRLSRTAPYSSAVFVTRDETRKLAFSVSPSKTPHWQYESQIRRFQRVPVENAVFDIRIADVDCQQHIIAPYSLRRSSARMTAQSAGESIILTANSTRKFTPAQPMTRK